MQKFRNLFIFIIFIIIFLCVYFYYENTHKERAFYKVLKIISPVEYVIDFNKNGLADNDEEVKLIGVEAFENKVFTKKNLYYKKHLTIEDVVENYYLSMNFLNNYLLNKDVNVDIYSDEEVKFVRVYLNNEDVGKILLEHGYGIVKTDTFDYQYYLNFENIVKVKENSKKSDFDFVVLNKTNNIYHEKNCKIIHNLDNYEIKNRKDIPANYKPCGFCHVRPKQQKQYKKGKDNPPLLMNGIEIYILDFLRHNKPDQSCNTQACMKLLKLINTTQNSIDMAIYDFHDQPKIVEALKAAQKRGVNVRIVVDSKNYKNNKANYQRLLQILKSIKYDTSGKKQSRSIMHNKFVIFDKKIVFTGSANFTNTDLSGFSSNIVIVLDNKTAAKIYTTEFEQLWNGKFGISKDNLSQKQDLIEIYFSPQDKIITNNIIPLIKKAKKSIYIPGFIITHKKLKTALVDATKRGLEIKIITDATSAGNKHTVNKELRENGIKVKVENLAGKMHMKSMIIDNKTVVIGSMNFSRNGEDFNDENVLIIHNPQIAKYYEKYFFKVWNFIPDKWLYKNPPAESFASLGSCFDGIDNDYDEKIDSEDTGCQK